MDGETVQYEDDKVWYRSSALGMPCTKALIAARMSYQELRTRDEKILGVFSAGHRLESSVLSLMHDEGWIVWGQQETVKLMVTGRIGVRGHIDGKGRMSGQIDNYLVEIKTQTKDEWEKFENHGWESGFFPRYAWQVSSYMLATDMPLCLVRGLRNKDGDAIEKIDVSFVDKPIYSLEEIRARLLSVEVAAMKSELPDACDGKMYPCPFPYLCTDVDREEVDDEWLEAAARTFAKAEADRKSANKRYDDSKSALISTLGASKKIGLVSGTKITTWRQRTGPGRLSEDDRRALVFLLWWFHGVDVSSLEKQAEGQRIRVTLPTSERVADDE